MRALKHLDWTGDRKVPNGSTKAPAEHGSSIPADIASSGPYSRWRDHFESLNTRETDRRAKLRVVGAGSSPAKW